MIKRNLLILLALFSLVLPAFSQKVEVKGDNVMVDNILRLKIITTKKMNFLTTEMAHFSIYDAKDKEIIQYRDGTLTFLQSKSYVSDDGLLDPNKRSIAKFFGKESTLFTADGYDATKEKEFILKNKGHLPNSNPIKLDEKGVVVRDKSKPFTIENNTIMQDEFIIGYISWTRKGNDWT